MGSQLNLQINAIAFADNTPSNNPMLRHFDLTYKLLGLAAKNPDQKPYSVAPGASQLIYDGTRTTAISATTEFNVTKPYADKNTYRFTWNGVGTNPAFRTDRAIGITTASQFSITVNGPIATITNTGGPFVTANIQVGDILLILSGAGPSAANQGRFSIIAKTTNSITIQNLNAAAQSFTVLDVTKMLVYSNGGSNNQAQIGDKVIISSGFSSATFGTYEIIEVTPTWFEVNVGYPNGIPLETAIAPTATGLIIYKTVKQFVLIAAQQKVSAGFNDDASKTVIIEPVEPDNPERPGVLLKSGSFYKLTIYNDGLNTANVIVATTE